MRMATALKPTQPNPPHRKRRSSSQRQARLRAIQANSNSAIAANQRAAKPKLAVISHPSTAAAVRQIPLKQPYPMWLKLLIRVQRGSLLVAIVLVTAALVVYGSTIYMQRYWGTKHGQLKSMQKGVRQMVVMNEALKNQIMQQAEQPGSGLVPRTPAHTIQLEPSPLRPTTPTGPLIIRAAPTSNTDPVSY